MQEGTAIKTNFIIKKYKNMRQSETESVRFSLKKQIKNMFIIVLIMIVSVWLSVARRLFMCTNANLIFIYACGVYWRSSHQCV